MFGFIIFSWTQIEGFEFDSFIDFLMNSSVDTFLLLFFVRIKKKLFFIYLLFKESPFLLLVN